MTHQSKYNENKRSITAYAEYLDECTTLDGKIKMSGEIGRLTEQNKAIGQMTFEEAKNNRDEYFIEVNAFLPNIGELEPVWVSGQFVHNSQP